MKAEKLSNMAKTEKMLNIKNECFCGKTISKNKEICQKCLAKNCQHIYKKKTLFWGNSGFIILKVFEKCKKCKKEVIFDRKSYGINFNNLNEVDLNYFANTLLEMEKRSKNGRL